MQGAHERQHWKNDKIADDKWRCRERGRLLSREIERMNDVCAQWNLQYDYISKDGGLCNVGVPRSRTLWKDHILILNGVASKPWSQRKVLLHTRTLFVFLFIARDCLFAYLDHLTGNLLWRLEPEDAPCHGDLELTQQGVVVTWNSLNKVSWWPGTHSTRLSYGELWHRCNFSESNIAQD
jgi:hypothetical protein